MRELSPGQIAYRRYLKSDSWKAIRERAVERDGGKCQNDLGEGVICLDTERLHVHHIRYRTPWEDTRLEDLRTVCRECHRIEHGKKLRWPFEVLMKELWARAVSDPFKGAGEMEEQQLVDMAHKDSLSVDDDWKNEVLGYFRFCEKCLSGKEGPDGPDGSIRFQRAREKWSKIMAKNRRNPPEEYLYVW